MYLLFDIGGTNTRIATSETGRSIQKYAVIPTAENFTKAIENFHSVALKFGCRRGNVCAVIGGVRALDKKRGVLRAEPHYPLWVGKPLLRELRHLFSSPVHLENDAALAALGEAVEGAGKGYNIVAYITVSTGVGGALVIHQELVHHADGFEPGNQIILERRKKLIRLEALISGHALQKKYGMPASKLKNKKLWRAVAHYLAVGLNNSIVHWSPDIVVLGGGLLRPGGISLAEVRKQLKLILTVYPKLPVVVRSTLGDKSALYGALALARSEKILDL